MEVQFHEGAVNVPEGKTETKSYPYTLRAEDADAITTFDGTVRSKERRRTGRRYDVYLVNRSTPETFFDYSGGCFSYQSYGGFFFFTAPGSKVFIPYHQIVRIEVSG